MTNWTPIAINALKDAGVVTRYTPTLYKITWYIIHCMYQASMNMLLSKDTSHSLTVSLVCYKAATHYQGYHTYTTSV